MKIGNCPFCGKDVATIANCQEMKECESMGSCKSHYFLVVCTFSRGGCGASSGYFPTPEEAAEAWNQRKGQKEPHPDA